MRRSLAAALLGNLFDQPERMALAKIRLLLTIEMSCERKVVPLLTQVPADTVPFQKAGDHRQ